MQSTSTRTREEVSERRKTVLATLAIVAAFYSVIHWGVPLLLHEPSSTKPLFGFMAGWPNWISSGFVPLDYLYLVVVLLWASSQLDTAFDKDGKAESSRLNNIKIPVLVFGPVLLLFTVSLFGWCSGTIFAVLVGVGMTLGLTAVYFIAMILMNGLGKFGHLLTKLGASLRRTGIGHHVANYLNAEDIPATNTTKE